MLIFQTPTWTERLEKIMPILCDGYAMYLCGILWHDWIRLHCNPTFPIAKDSASDTFFVRLTRKWGVNRYKGVTNNKKGLEMSEQFVFFAFEPEKSQEESPLSKMRQAMILSSVEGVISKLKPLGHTINFHSPHVLKKEVEFNPNVRMRSKRFNFLISYKTDKEGLENNNKKRYFEANLLLQVKKYLQKNFNLGVRATCISTFKRDGIYGYRATTLNKVLFGEERVEIQESLTENRDSFGLSDVVMAVEHPIYSSLIPTDDFPKVSSLRVLTEKGFEDVDKVYSDSSHILRFGLNLMKDKYDKLDKLSSKDVNKELITTSLFKLKNEVRINAGEGIWYLLSPLSSTFHHAILEHSGLGKTIQSFAQNVGDY